MMSWRCFIHTSDSMDFLSAIFFLWWCTCFVHFILFSVFLHLFGFCLLVCKKPLQEIYSARFSNENVVIFFCHCFLGLFFHGLLFVYVCYFIRMFAFVVSCLVSTLWSHDAEKKLLLIWLIYDITWSLNSIAYSIFHPHLNLNNEKKTRLRMLSITFRT